MLPPVAPGAGDRRDYLTKTPVGRDASTGLTNREVFDALGHSDRQRDIFPLPPLRRDHAGAAGRQDLSRVTRRRGEAAKHILDWGDDCIDALNDLYGHQDRPAAPANAGQRHAVDYVESRVRALGKPPPEAGFREGALRELLAGTGIYQTDDLSSRRPYVKESISWPSPDLQPVSLTSCLSEAESEWLGRWQSTLLRPDKPTAAERAEFCPHGPFFDPSLFSKPLLYADFVAKLLARGMVELKRDCDAATVGCFFVTKKNKKLRVIFDTRYANLFFGRPARTALPTATALAAFENPGHDTYMASGDIDNAFYRLRLPDGLSSYFRLPAVDASLLGITHLDGAPLARGARVQPCVCVLPMGWSHALALCQGVLRRAMATAGFTVDQCVEDGKAGVVVDREDALAAAGYVDNYASLGRSPARVDQATLAITRVLTEKGLLTHDEEPAARDATFVGLELKRGRHLSIKARSIWRLRFGLDALLRKGFCSGDALRVIIGHFTWAGLIRREVLSLLNASYQFAERVGPRQARLWRSVRRELWHARCILPLLSVDLSAEWWPEVAASDASLFGLGVTVRKAPTQLVSSIGRCSERWRFRVEGAQRAREHALHQAPVDPMSYPDKALENLLVDNPSAFDEVPSDFLKSDSWKVVHASKVAGSTNILELEGEALLMAIRHTLRNTGALGKKILFIVDNLPLALGATKGRANSRYLRHVLQKIAALSLTTGCKIVVRWVPSELNPADHPSRGDHGFFTTPFHVHLSRRHGAAPAASGGAGRHRAGAERPARSGLDGADLRPLSPRVRGDPPEHAEAVPQPPGDAGPLLPDVPPGLGQLGVAGQCHHRAAELPVPGRQVLGPGDAADRGALPRLPEPGPAQRTVPAARVPSRRSLEATGSRALKAADAEDRRGGHRGGHAVQRPPSDGHLHHADLHLLPQTAGGDRAAGPALGCPGVGGRTELCKLGAPAPRLRPRPAVQDRHDGRRGAHRPGQLDPPDARGAPGGDPRGRLAVGLRRDGVQADLQGRRRPAGSGATGPAPVLATSRRRVGRPPDQTPKPGASASSGPLGVGIKPSPIHQGHAPAARASGGSQRRLQLRGLCDEPVHGARGARADRPAFRPGPGEREISPDREPQDRGHVRRRPQAKTASSVNHLVQGGDVNAYLGKKFVSSLSRAVRLKSLLFLELFGGCGRVAASAQAMGYAALSLDINASPLENHLSPVFLNKILGWISSGAIAGVWLGTPCSTWTRALRVPLRTEQHPDGRPDLSPDQFHKLDIGNKSFLFSLHVIRACLRHGIGAMIENPQTSLMWSSPHFHKLLNLKSSTSVVSHMCQFGAPWRKATRVQAWGVGELWELAKKCGGPRGFCSRTLRPHLELTGRAPGGKHWTSIAAAYPDAFARAAAAILVRTCENKRSLALSRRMGG